MSLRDLLYDLQFIIILNHPASAGLTGTGNPMVCVSYVFSPDPAADLIIKHGG